MGTESLNPLEELGIWKNLQNPPPKRINGNPVSVNVKTVEPSLDWRYNLCRKKKHSNGNCLKLKRKKTIEKSLEKI